MPDILPSHADETSAADVAIVGLGPGGLAAALEAAASGKQVVAFTDRSEYIRGQRLILLQTTIDFLKKHRNDDDEEDTLFWDKHQKEGTAQTKDIERYLYRKLLTYQNVTLIRTSKDTKTINSIENGPGKTASCIQLSDGQKIYTRNILAADGARHDFANLMNKSLRAGIKYGQSPVQERHRYHGVVQLRLKYEDCTLLKSSQDPRSLTTEELSQRLQNKDGCIKYQDQLFYFDHKETDEPLKALEGETTVDLNKLFSRAIDDEARVATFKDHKIINKATKRFIQPAVFASNYDNSSRMHHRVMDCMKAGWEQVFEPKYYIFPNEDKTKFYFAGEIPKAIFEIPDEAERGEKLKNWACLAIQHNYGFTPEQLEYRHSKTTPTKNKLQATVFEMDMKVCQQTVVPLCNGVFSQVGDARRTPNYNLAHGLNDAVAGGIAFVSSIHTAEPDRAASFDKFFYERTIKSMDTKVESLMTKKAIEGSQQILLKSIDKLITRLEKSKAVDENSLMLLKWERHHFEASKNINTMRKAIDAVKPQVERHPHRDIGVGYCLWRCFAAIFSFRAAKTKSAIFLEDTKQLLDKASRNPNS